MDWKGKNQVWGLALGPVQSSPGSDPGSSPVLGLVLGPGPGSCQGSGQGSSLGTGPCLGSSQASVKVYTVYPKTSEP
jgi:hypothetical protein